MEVLYIVLWVGNLIAQSRGMECNYPALPNYSKAITQQRVLYNVNSHFYYQCADGYHFKVSGTDRHKVICTDGHWQPTFWKCMDDCGNKCMPHGDCVKTIGPKSGDTVSKCHCHRNYAGNKCDARVCETPHVNPPHLSPVKVKGEEIRGKYSLGSQIHYHCEQGYEIKQENIFAECTSHGWSPPQIPECQEKTCPNMGFLHGSISISPPKGEPFKPGEIVTFTCSPGFELRGESHLKCAKGGMWLPSNKWPNCEAYSCGEPQGVRYATFTSSAPLSYPVGTKVTYTCFEEYWMAGDATVTCNEARYNGQPWWGIRPHCYSRNDCKLRNKEISKKDDKLVCIDIRSGGGSRVVTSTVSSTVKPLTIVTATAGALLLLLLIVISLVAYQRRRIAINNRRQGRERFHNEEDRFSFVYYSNDVHVVLPSYDEAMRVQGAPPPYANDGTINATSSENANTGVGRAESATSSVHNQPNITEVTDDTEISSNYREGQVIANGPQSINACTGIASSNINNEHIDNPHERLELNNSNKEGDSELETDNPVNMDIHVIDTNDIFDDDTIPLFVDGRN